MHKHTHAHTCVYEIGLLSDTQMLYLQYTSGPLISLIIICLCAHCVFPSRYRQVKQQYELKVEEEQILQTKLQQSSFHQQQEELERLRKAIGQDANQTKLCLQFNEVACVN